VPSKSKSQQRLFQAAEHGAQFAAAKKLRATLSEQQLHDFASGSMKGKPEHTHNLGSYLRVTKKGRH
jgi:hypothetical protein